MRSYEWMIEHTPQKEWIEKRGILVWVAFFFVELGAGTFFISSILGISMGMVFGWLVCAVLGGGLHLLYLGHPLRSWRILVSSGWKSSWISRGLYFVVFFLVLGAIGLILKRWWGSSAFGLMIATDIFAFLPSKAGAGTSTIALNVSAAMSRRPDTHVMLSDFDLNSGMKDLQAMIAEAKSRGVELPLVERTLGCFDEAKRQVTGESELSLVSAYWAKR